MANLLDNALRHARSSVRVGLRSEGGDVVFEIDDDGPGLPDGAEDRAFERFVSLDSEGGSGLGLAVVRAAAEAHGGDAGYAEGVFRLRIPAPPASPTVLVPGRPSER